MLAAPILRRVSIARLRDLADLRIRPRLIVGFAILFAALLLAIGDLLAVTAHPAVRLAPASTAVAIVSEGFYEVEQDSRGSFRWTNGDAQATLTMPGWGRPAVAVLWIGPGVPAHPTSRLTIGFGEGSSVSWRTDDRPRQYHMLLPEPVARSEHVTLRLMSDTSVIPPDTRAVGVRVEGIELRLLGKGPLAPVPTRVIEELLLLVGCALLLLRLGARPALTVGGITLAAAGLALSYLRQGLLIYPVYLAHMLVAVGLLVLLTYAGLPVVERWFGRFASPRLLRALWAVALLACGIRLIGALYPLFSAYDLSLNLERFTSTATGILVQTHRSFEFHGGTTVYPPGPYLALLPTLLLGISPKLALQGGIALLDGFGALTLGLFARMLGASERTALLGALLYAAIPIDLTSLWYGHTGQVFGQWLMVPLAMALLFALRQPRMRYWICAGVLLSMALLSHIGVSILAIAWLGLAWLALLVRRTLPASSWWRLTLTLAISCAVGFILAYAPAALINLHQLQKVVQKMSSDTAWPAYNLIAKAFAISYSQLGLPLLFLGLPFVSLRRLPRGASELLGAWCAAVAIFWVIEMWSGLQVRYLIFFIPLACLLIGLLLDRLSRRGNGAWLLARLVVLLLLVQGCVIWYGGIFLGVAPSMIPLLR